MAAKSPHHSREKIIVCCFGTTTTEEASSYYYCTCSYGAWWAVVVVAVAVPWRAAAYASLPCLRAPCWLLGGLGTRNKKRPGSLPTVPPSTTSYSYCAGSTSYSTCRQYWCSSAPPALVQCVWLASYCFEVSINTADRRRRVRRTSKEYCRSYSHQYWLEAVVVSSYVTVAACSQLRSYRQTELQKQSY